MSVDIDFRTELESAFEIILRKQKPSIAQFSKIHKCVYLLANSQDTSDLKKLYDSTVGSVQHFVLQSIIIPLQRATESKSTFGVDDQSSLESSVSSIWNSIIAIEKLINSVFNGRKWFLENHSDVLICASSYFKQQLKSLDVYPVLRKSLQSSPTLEPLFSFLDELTSRNTYVGMLNSLQSSSTPLPRHYFTRTKNVLVPFEYAFTPEMSVASIFPHKIDLNLSQTAFVIENFFTPSECEHLIKKSEEVGYTSIETEFLKTNRDNQRILLMSREFASEVLKRVSPFIQEIPDIQSKRPFGFNSKGKWELCGINECFRFCKYVAPSVGFSPHRDASFVRNEDERSIFTIMFYLNDDFSGGTTNFMKLFTPGNMDETIEEEMKRGYSTEFKFVPKTGTAIVFEHNILHEGSSLIEGVKYIARTDVVFKRTQNPGDDSWRKDPQYLKMLDYYRRAGEEECKGNVALSSEYYERALSIRQNYVEI